MGKGLVAYALVAEVLAVAELIAVSRYRHRTRLAVRTCSYGLVGDGITALYYYFMLPCVAGALKRNLACDAIVVIVSCM